MSNNRAVSEVIGALLMITLAVTAGILVYVYSSGLMGSLYGAKVQQPYVEHLSLDYYKWSLGSTSGNVTLKLRNTGSAQVTLADFFIAGNQISHSNVMCQVNSPCPVTLSYSGPIASQFTRGLSYNVRAVTIDGAVFDFACIAGTAS